MSFIDLATLALHRRHEIEARIQKFLEKCDTAIQDIEKLKVQASGFVDRLNCEPSELKDRFLSSMSQLDEYMYLLTDFNLAIGKLDLPSNIVYTPPVQDTISVLQPIQAPVPNGKYNLMDALSEPTPSTSKACANNCPPEKDKQRKIPREEQLLIAFSSNSCSSESVPLPYNETKEPMQSQIDGIKKLTLDDSAYSDELNLPAQPMLEVDQVYPVIVMHTDGPMLWVIKDNCDLYDFLREMTNFYKENAVEMKMEDILSLTYCACYDEDTELYYRALIIKLNEDGSSMEVFLMDTGEVRTPRVSHIQPLHARFRRTPPHARCCHLAGIEASFESESAEKLANMLKEYVHSKCTITVDDNSSESLGVYVRLATGECLNELVVHEEHAEQSAPTRSRLEAELDDRNFDITNCPEYEDPVEAVTGYSNRDEMDICMHYKGGPEKTCFKGARCKKRHVLMHPDGWTLDRVSVTAHVPSPLLPAPGCWVRVLVTYIAYYNTLYVQMQDDRPEVAPALFGVVLPPASLEQLVLDMNSNASRTAMKPLTLIPAVGELVAALYPPDEQWYRARVLSITPVDQNVEVMYIDYGNIVWVRWDKVRALEARWCVLAEQAVRCTLAGVTVDPPQPAATTAARDALSAIAKDKRMDARVVARGFDELTVELYDERGFSVAEQLLTNPNVKPKPYTIVQDEYETQKVVVP